MSTSGSPRHVVAACFLGWTLDAFDFFLLIFVLSDVAGEFQVTMTSVTWALTLTLAFRAVGAVIFGWLADRYGRRPTLMLNLVAFSVIAFASAFAPDLAVFLVLRALFGIAMGGEWGVGASLTMESIPTRWRGTVSGILQCGYPVGYLLAALVYWLAYAHVGWRGMLMFGAVPALLILYIRRNVPESPDWLRRKTAAKVDIWAVARQRLPLFIYAIAIMTAFNLFSHATQDLYPNAFLKVQHGLSVRAVSTIAIIANLGAILGCLLAGTLSQVLGRRRMIVAMCLGALCVMPFWAFASAPLWFAITAFLMQFMVQGAFGVVPAHLNEMSPPEVRGTFPGFTYQFGNLLASSNATIQATIAARMGGDYSWALAGVAAAGALTIVLLIGFARREGRHLDMSGATAEPIRNMAADSRAPAPAPAPTGRAARTAAP